jgi:hypothetical protein
MNSENENPRIIRDNDAAERVMSTMINRIPMRPAVAERFDDAKTPLPDIQTENKD